MTYIFFHFSLWHHLIIMVTSRLTYSFCIVHLIWLFIYILPQVREMIIEKCTGYYLCQKNIHKTQIFGYNIDISDKQWMEFRYHLWWLWCLIPITCICRFIMKRYNMTDMKSVTSYSIFIGFVGLFILHGYQALVIIAIILYGFTLSRITYKLDGHVAYIWPWIYSIFILFVKEAYFLRRIYPRSWLFIFIFDSKYSRLYHWQLSCNLLILRYLSFCIDRVNSYRKKLSGSTSSGKKNEYKTTSPNLNPDPIDTLTDTSTIPSVILSKPTRLRMRYYQREYYISYILYLPLYIAGPVIRYDDYIKARLASSPNQHESSIVKNTESDMTDTNKSMSIYDIVIYSIQWIGVLILMEVLTSAIPALAIINSNLLPHLSLVEILVVSYISLKIIWIKYTLIWRFFRLWAICDGIQPVENISSIIWINYNLEKYWKSWHISFHNWIEYYIYLPLGGWNYRVYTFILIFLFLAVWYNFDSNFFFLVFLNMSLYGVEMITMQSKQSDISNNNDIAYKIYSSIYTHLLLFINILGYTVGHSNLIFIQSRFLTWEGLKICLFTLYFYYWILKLFHSS